MAALNERNDKALCGSRSLFSLPSGEDNGRVLTLCLGIVGLLSGLNTKRFLLVSKKRGVSSTSS